MVEHNKCPSNHLPCLIHFHLHLILGKVIIGCCFHLVCHHHPFQERMRKEVLKEVPPWFHLLVFSSPLHCHWARTSKFSTFNTDLQPTYIVRLLFPPGINWTLRVKFPGGSDGKKSACNAGDLRSLPGSGRSPGDGNGYPLQYSCYDMRELHGQRSLALHEDTRSWTLPSVFALHC